MVTSWDSIRDDDVVDLSVNFVGDINLGISFTQIFRLKLTGATPNRLRSLDDIEFDFWRTDNIVLNKHI